MFVVVVADQNINAVPSSCFISRQKASLNIPSHEQLMAIKRKKKVSTLDLSAS